MVSLRLPVLKFKLLSRKSTDVIFDVTIIESLHSLNFIFFSVLFADQLISQTCKDHHHHHQGVNQC